MHRADEAHAPALRRGRGGLAPLGVALTALGIYLLFGLCIAAAAGWGILYAHRQSSDGLGRESRQERTARLGRAPSSTARFSRDELAARRAELRDLVAATRADRAYTREESEQVRDDLLRTLADVGALKLERPIDHAGGIPTSTLHASDQGRELVCELRGLGARYDLALRLELEKASHVHLRLRHEDALSPEERAHGSEHEVGDPDFDRTFWIESKGWAGVAPLAEYPEARAAVAKVFQIPGVTTLTIMRGRIRLDGELDAETPRERLLGMLAALRFLGRIYQGEPPPTLALAARPRELEGPQRCPFCRDDLGAADEVLSCPGCGTPQHLECHQENGGCPVLGCGHTARGVAARESA